MTPKNTKAYTRMTYCRRCKRTTLHTYTHGKWKCNVCGKFNN